MLVYPQLPTGALVQFPAQKLRRPRTVVNAMADGSSFKLADPAGETTEWQLQYVGLSEAEMSALETFFEAAEGSLQVFTFLDPMGNLFAFSDHLDNAVWSKDPLLTATGGVTDPFGGTNGWQLTNTGQAAQSITQTLAAPGGYLYCLSAYVKASSPGTPVTVFRGSATSAQVVGTNWTRVTTAGCGDASATSIAFGIEVPAGSWLDVYGLQVEPQAAASVYQPSTGGGVYANTSFRDDSLSWTATDLHLYSVTVNLINGYRQ